MCNAAIGPKARFRVSKFPCRSTSLFDANIAMRLTTMTDYALRLLMYVAQHPQRLCTISEVARAYDISEAHLMKTTHQLGRAGWLETVRGKGGGMRLAAAPADINLGAVVRSVEPDFFLVSCLASDPLCLLTGSCRLTGIVSGALNSFLEHLDRYTLADLLPPPGKGAVRVQPVGFDIRPEVATGVGRVSPGSRKLKRTFT
jgi:Rrf2 family transcriptional regulator, nitric oxide-sensitive transcriptional repressor